MDVALTAADHVPAAQGVGEVDAEGQKSPPGHPAHALPFMKLPAGHEMMVPVIDTPLAARTQEADAADFDAPSAKQSTFEGSMFSKAVGTAGVNV